MPSLTEAIEEKYSPENHDNPEEDSNGQKNKGFVIIAPKLTALDCVPNTLVFNNKFNFNKHVVDKRNVDSAGDLEKLQKLCRNVVELNLSHNNLNNWIEVEKILIHTPKAQFVNLSFNDLCAPLSVGNFVEVLPNLKYLVLIGTNIQWKTIHKILSSACNLNELHLSFNNYRTVELFKEEGFTSLNRLTFDGNLVDDWTQVSKLGKLFPNLIQLSVSKCPLRFIGDAKIHQEFTQLKVLNLSETRIETHDEIEKLNEFLVLEEVRLGGIPFLQSLDDRKKRTELIALLPKISKLNGGAVITEDERVDCERYFIRKYMNAEMKPTKYAELVQKHGELEPLVEVKLKRVKSVLLKIKFGQMELEKPIDVNQTVKELKKHLEPIVGVQPSRMVLYYLDVGIEFGRDILRYPDKKLYTYHMRDGDEIHVKLKNNTGHEIDSSI